MAEIVNIWEQWVHKENQTSHNQEKLALINLPSLLIKDGHLSGALSTHKLLFLSKNFLATGAK